MDWCAEYVKAAAVEDGDVSATSSTTQTKKTEVLVFLDLLLTHEGGEWWTKFRRAVKKSDQKDKKLSEEDKKQLKALKKRLATVGSELMMKLPELNASVSSKETPRSAKVRVLQLQLICRMLRYGVQKKEEKKQLKKEIRGLLDRVALLLDAANPPSLADEDADERSPFQGFLQQALAPKLQMLLPDLVQYLLRAYELEEEDANEEETINAMLPMLLLVKESQPPIDVPPSEVAGKGSILSALRQERPSKRSRPDANGLFKEVQLPHHLQQKQMQTRPRKSRRLSSKVNSSSSTRISQNALLRAAADTKPARASTTLGIAMKPAVRPGSSSRKPGNSDLLRRVANSSRTSVSAAPSLQRTLSERPLHREGVAGPAAGKHQLTPLRRATTASSVVMGTPDRPKRMTARTTRRVLVEASPPLRKPSGVAAAPRLLQKSSRPGSNPPPLFR